MTPLPVANFDCKNTDYGPGGADPDEDPVTKQPPDVDNADCAIAPDMPNEFGGGQAPNLFADP